MPDHRDMRPPDAPLWPVAGVAAFLIVLAFLGGYVIGGLFQ